MTRSLALAACLFAIAPAAIAADSPSAPAVSARVPADAKGMAEPRSSVGYACGDLPVLEAAVNRLKNSCVPSGNCTTIVGSGAKPSEAIDACIRQASAADACARNVNCSGGVLICRAMGIAGDTINDAIARCQKIGTAGDLCSRNVECSGRGYQICRSSVFTGHTIDEAVKNCTNSGLGLGICSANVRCESF